MIRLIPLTILACCLLAPTAQASDATLATITYNQGSGRGHKVGALAVTTTEQQIILNYQPGELTVIQVTAEPGNTTNLQIRDVIGDATTTRTLTPGQTYSRQLAAPGGLDTLYVLMASGTGTCGIERLQ